MFRKLLLKRIPASEGIRKLGEQMINSPDEWEAGIYEYFNKNHRDIAIWTCNGIPHIEISGFKCLTLSDKIYLANAIKLSIANRVTEKKQQTMKTHLISYPRSGNTLFRYIIEAATGKPTDGTCDNPERKNRLMQPLIHTGRTDFSMYKSHTFNYVQPEDTIILLLRDYKECIIRHHKQNRGISFDLFKKQTFGLNSDYISLLKSYNKHPGIKLLYYYEDFVNGNFPFNIFKKVVFNKWKEESLKLYPASQTKGNDIYFHSKQLTSEEIKQWDTHIKNTHPELFNKYLKRYKCS